MRRLAVDVAAGIVVVVAAAGRSVAAFAAGESADAFVAAIVVVVATVAAAIVAVAAAAAAAAAAAETLAAADKTGSFAPQAPQPQTHPETAAGPALSLPSPAPCTTCCPPWVPSSAPPAKFRTGLPCPRAYRPSPHPCRCSQTRHNPAAAGD